MTKKPKSAAPETAPNMTAAQHLFGVPKYIQILAKSRGCRAFSGQRVHRRQLLEWTRRNHRLVAEVTAQREAQAADRNEMEQLKVRKLRVEIEALDLKRQNDLGLLMLKTEAAELYDRCVAIVCEEAQLMMDRPTYAAFIAGIHRRYEPLRALGESQHGPPPPPASSLS
ncbi:MAG: hypothetical protein WCO57_17230 [Verrucomicrobiota bacterium]